MDTSLFDKAAQFAIEAHKGTERRGKGFPYIIHPMEAATIVANITNDPEMLAAAILHDTVEDTDVTIEQIEELFGPRVARLVNTDTAMKSGSWRTRRVVQIERFRQSDRDSQVVALGDKLSNLRAIALDTKCWATPYGAASTLPKAKRTSSGTTAALLMPSSTSPTPPPIKNSSPC